MVIKEIAIMKYNFKMNTRRRLISNNQIGFEITNFDIPEVSTLPDEYFNIDNAIYATKGAMAVTISKECRFLFDEKKVVSFRKGDIVTEKQFNFLLSVLDNAPKRLFEIAEDKNEMQELLSCNDESSHESSHGTSIEIPFKFDQKNNVPVPSFNDFISREENLKTSSKKVNRKEIKNENEKSKHRNTFIIMRVKKPNAPYQNYPIGYLVAMLNNKNEIAIGYSAWNYNVDKFDKKFARNQAMKRARLDKIEKMPHLYSITSRKGNGVDCLFKIIKRARRVFKGCDLSYNTRMTLHNAGIK